MHVLHSVWLVVGCSLVWFLVWFWFEAFLGGRRVGGWGLGLFSCLFMFGSFLLWGCWVFLLLLLGFLVWLACLGLFFWGINLIREINFFIEFYWNEFTLYTSTEFQCQWKPERNNPACSLNPTYKFNCSFSISCVGKVKVKPTTSIFH